MLYQYELHTKDGQFITTVTLSKTLSEGGRLTLKNSPQEQDYVYNVLKVNYGMYDEKILVVEPVKKLTIYTSRISYRGSGKIDISVKSGDSVFAPSWDIVMGVKNNTITTYQYTQAYYAMMRQSWNANRARWMEVMNMDKVVLCCYCAAGEFCHRHLLSDMLIKCCKAYGIEAIYGGEI